MPWSSSNVELGVIELTVQR